MGGGGCEWGTINNTHHFDPDSAIALASFCEHVAPTLADISHPYGFGSLL